MNDRVIITCLFEHVGKPIIMGVDEEVITRDEMYELFSVHCCHIASDQKPSENKAKVKVAIKIESSLCESRNMNVCGLIPFI